jgi:hypothetical protein
LFIVQEPLSPENSGTDSVGIELRLDSEINFIDDPDSPRKLFYS